jgi:hypothetical protein
MRFGQDLGFTEAPFLLGGLCAGEVPSPGRTVQQLTCGSQLEALGNGLFGLLHGELSKTERGGSLGKGEMHFQAKSILLGPVLKAKPW